MSSNNDKKIGTITFNNLNFNGKKVDFSNIKSFSNNSGELRKNEFKKPQFNTQNNNTTSSTGTNIKSENQLRKFDFSYLKKDKEQSNENTTQNQKNENQNNDFKNRINTRDQFRKPTLSFQSQQNNTNKQENQNGNKQNNNGFQKQNQNQFNNNKKFGNDKKFFNNNDKQNNQNNSKKFDKNSNFFKKSSQVKVKLKQDVKKDFAKQTFKKTTNTGSNIDKYSINGMLKTISNNIELDTEIDDVLGNVISVKLSGINSSNSLQKERKVRGASNKSNKQQVNFITPIVRKIEIYNNKISLSSLADQMAISVKELCKLLKSEGITIDTFGKDIGNIEIDGDTAEIVAESCGHIIKRISDNDTENNFIAEVQKTRTDIRQRAPIVTIMGHVDHGKTTLLDYIRKSSVASGEAGGITQHIGAYRTKVRDKMITFLDTPGHAAFTEMRARGAKITDIVIIVVAADDGIMPQTEEAISHAKNSGCPIIVAINKIDKPEANIEKTKQMLFQYELVPEELGGDVIVVPISAKEGRNIDKLLDAILVQAEVLELKASYNGIPEGFVVEAKMDKKRGALATVIVKEVTETSPELKLPYHDQLL